ncbi:MAG: glycosyltransferase [Armatimonadetes bacterium 55-13]|nr:WecB/TagA/CpsF family glycosyltransferase [Armatimonadota bacterium]OJU63453.1 MAG: glycosyltransferase [Armatimonadetes bacterium 55-13]
MTLNADISRPSRVEILGMPVDRLGMNETLRVLESFVAEKRPHLVVTADASGIVQAQDDPEFQELFKSADLITPDSIGVIWAAKRKGMPITERVSGVDLVDRICGLSADKGYRIFFLGAAPGVAELAAEKMRLKHPGCNIVGARHGFFPADSDAIIAQEVAETQPDFLFVAMGIPRQEKFIKATEGIINASVSMGVGGSFDVFSGKVRRAPKFFQALHLEWLWRLLQNPKKIAKVKNLPKFVWLILRSPR